MKKIAMHVMLIALTLFLIACNPETDNKDKTEDVKTSLSFSLSYEGIKELNDFSVEISISKEKDHPIDTFTLTQQVQKLYTEASLGTSRRCQRRDPEALQLPCASSSCCEL